MNSITMTSEQCKLLILGFARKHFEKQLSHPLVDLILMNANVSFINGVAYRLYNTLQEDIWDEINNNIFSYQLMSFIDNKYSQSCPFFVYEEIILEIGDYKKQTNHNMTLSNDDEICLSDTTSGDYKLPSNSRINKWNFTKNHLTTVCKIGYNMCLKDDFSEQFNIIIYNWDAVKNKLMIVFNSEYNIKVFIAGCKQSSVRLIKFDGFIMFTDYKFNNLSKKDKEYNVEIELGPKHNVNSDQVYGINFRIGLIGIDVNYINDYFDKNPEAKKDYKKFNLMNFLWNTSNDDSIIFHSYYLHREMVDHLNLNELHQKRDNNIKFMMKFINAGNNKLKIEFKQRSDCLMMFRRHGRTLLEINLKDKYVYYFFVADTNIQCVSKYYFYRITLGVKDKL